MARTKVVKEKALEDILFDCRNSLRGRAPMTDKRDLLLTLVFLKFIDYRFLKQQDKIREKYKSRGDEGYVNFALSRPSEYAQDGVFFLSEDIRWETLKVSNPNTMAIDFDNAIKKLEDIEVGTRDGRPVRPLRNALPQQIFTKTNLEPGVIKEVVNNIDMIDPDKFGQTDLIGRVYEYFLQAFSINADKEEGEFYTPHSIVELIATLVEPYDGTLYDPCCGSGGMFVQSMKLLEAHGGNTKAVNVYGQESEPATYRLAKMNLAVRGISYDLGEKAISTFSDDQHKDKKFDYIMANPPFNLKPWWTVDKNLEDDPRWKGYPAPPLSNANYAWILHMLSKLDPNHGVAGFLLSNGALDDQDALEVRKKLLTNDKVEAIIVLPREMFYSTDISVTLWILNNNKKGGEHHGRMLRNRQNEILFVDLRTWNQNIYEKKYVKFSEEQIQAIQKIYLDWQTASSETYASPELYYSATLEEIKSKNFSLVPSRYIEFIDRDTEIDYNEALSTSSDNIASLLKAQRDNSEKLAEAFKLLGHEIKF